MNRAFFLISKQLLLLTRPQKSSYILQTLALARICVCACKSCEIPASTALVNWPKICTAEFGSFAFAQKNTHKCRPKPIYSSPSRSVSSASKKYKMGSLDSVADVDIDSSGKFKYILIEIEKGGHKKTIVRGYKWAGYHGKYIEIRTVFVVCFKWSSKRNSLTTHFGMVICTHYLTRVYSKLTQGHFLHTFTSFRKCHFKDHVHVWLDKSFLDGTVFALAFFELWERTNWHPVSNTQRLRQWGNI